MRSAITGLPFAFVVLALITAAQAAGDREAKVRDDRLRLGDDAYWIYNDLDRGLAEARRTRKPLLVVFRCIPCEACSEFDEQVVRRDPEVRRLMDQFVAVRIVHANGMDLSLFQFDFDQSFAAFFMNADKTIYGRFATRSASKDESQDMTMEGFAQALEGALELHAAYPANRHALAGKQSPPSSVRAPEEFPSLRGKYGPRLNYEGNVVQSCIHCHQVAEAERLVYRTNRQPLPTKLLRPYPLPQTIGLTLDPRTRATVRSVAAGTPAAQAGFRPQDEIVLLQGQPILSIADIQWVLHHADDAAELTARVRRENSEQDLQLSLPPGWRNASEISWRATTWDLRRMATGGLVLRALPPNERRGLSEGEMALRVEYVGQYGEHAAAQRAGFRKDDIIVAFDGRNDLASESDLLAYVLQEKTDRGEVTVTVLRNGRRQNLTLPLR
jgi:serine protease Do